MQPGNFTASPQTIHTLPPSQTNISCCLVFPPTSNIPPYSSLLHDLISYFTKSLQAIKREISLAVTTRTRNLAASVSTNQFLLFLQWVNYPCASEGESFNLFTGFCTSPNFTYSRTTLQQFHILFPAWSVPLSLLDRYHQLKTYCEIPSFNNFSIQVLVESFINKLIQSF